MKVKLKFIVLAALVMLSSPLYALEDKVFELFPEGEYQLKEQRGEGECPEERIIHLAKDESRETAILLFGAKYSVVLEAEEQSERIEGGCHYQTSLQLSDTSLSKKIVLSECQDESENRTIRNTFSKTNEGFEFHHLSNDELVFSCFYKK